MKEQGWTFNLIHAMVVSVWSRAGMFPLHTDFTTSLPFEKSPNHADHIVNGSHNPKIVKHSITAWD